MPRNKKSKKAKPLPPVREAMCATCPFRNGSPTAFLALYLTEAALTKGSRICHSTGGNKTIHKNTNVPEKFCRGARDIQLKYFAALKVIAEPTDEAWDAKWKEIQETKQNEIHHQHPGNEEANQARVLPPVSDGREVLLHKQKGMPSGPAARPC